MTLFVGGEDIRALATDAVCQAAAAAALSAESGGRTFLPPRIDAPSSTGFIRTMPAVLDNVMGLKVMTLVRGVGNRYLVLLYSVVSGDLLAVLDADELTRLRTAANTAVAASLITAVPQSHIAVVGSGSEAEGHLRALARIWPLSSACVFSPSSSRCLDFAQRMTQALALDVTPMPDVAAAVGSADVVVLATKSKQPVLDGAALRPGAVVLSIGSTRPDLRELDERTMARSGTIVVDDKAQVVAESGDIMAGLSGGYVDEARLVGLAAVQLDPTLIERSDEHDVVTFKSVGTALQDLALANAVFDAAQARGTGRSLGELARLKRPADTSVLVGGVQ